MSRSTRVVVGGAVLAAVAAGAYLLASGSTVSEVLELASEGGEKILRDPMRAPGPAPRVLVFALDGVGEDEFHAAVRSGGAPNVARRLGAERTEPGVYANAYSVPGVLSVLPSITLAAWSSVFTGEPPARTGVPGNEWFDRTTLRFHAPGAVSIPESDDAVRVYTESSMGQVVQVPTLYEQAGVRSFVSLSQVYRGADLLTMPEPEDLAEVMTAVASGLMDEETAEQEAYQELDEASVESLLQSLAEHRIPDLQVVYLPGIDLYTHVAEEPLEDQRRYLREVVDRAVGRVLAAYQEAGVLDGAYVVFVSDHGHTPVVADDRHALGFGGEDEPTAVLTGAGFRLRPPVLEPDEDERDFQAAVAYQGAFAFVYLADRSTCPAAGDLCDWSRRPRLTEDVLPVVRAFDAANRTGAGVPALRGTIDLILSRVPVAPGRSQNPFQVWDGERLVPVGEYLSRNPRPDLLDLEARLEGLAAGPQGHLAGDVVLLARSGQDLPIDERFYFSGLYRSWHGSPSAQDSRIPLVVASPARTGEELRALVGDAVGESPSQLDVTRLILALLDLTPPPTPR